MDNKKSWYKIQAKADDVIEIFIYDQIGVWGITASKFIRELKEKMTGTVIGIDLHINSPGGDVFDGNAIYAYLNSQQRVVNVFVEGLAASIASVIAMAGDTIHIAANSMIMIHNPIGAVFGESKDMRKMAETLDKVKDSIVVAYQKKTGRESDDLIKLMDDETWFTAQEAIDNGFADTLTGEVQVKNNFDLSKFKFRNIPAACWSGEQCMSETLQQPENQHQPENKGDSSEIQQLQAKIVAENERKETIKILFSMFPESEYQALFAECLANESCSPESACKHIIALKGKLIAGQPPVPTNSHTSFGEYEQGAESLLLVEARKRFPVGAA